MMPRCFHRLLDLTVPDAVRLLGIVVIALVLNRLLRAVTNLVIKKASAQSRPAQLREQQTRTLAEVLYSTVSKVVWAVALLTAVGIFHINILPEVTLPALVSPAVAFGAQTL